MFSFDSETPLPLSGAETCRGAAFDGCRYYLTVPCSCAVTVLDCGLRLVKTIETRRPYTAICHDPQRDCFWAASDQCRSALFRLDRALQETDRLTLPCEGRCSGPVTGISLCCDSGLLAVSRGNQLLEADPADGTARLLREERADTCILTVLSLPPYLMWTALRDCTATLTLTDRDGAVLSEEELPAELSAAALLLDPCGPDGYDLLLLANKRGRYPHLLRARLGAELAGGLCPCNRLLCRKCAEHCRCRQDCACADALESIALQEAAIAHILNAEGEKLQKIIEKSDDVCELLRANASVQRTILSAAQLEQLLLSKLEALRDICCFREAKEPPCRGPL